MHKQSNTLISVVLISIALISCGSGGENGNSMKYLARNIVFNTDLARNAYADQSQAIDTETQILAENVIFETNDNTQIESDNVQNALEEISHKLSGVIPGTWNIQNYNQENSHVATGRVIINGDGTFNLVSGSFAAIGMGSIGFCSHTEENQTYRIYTDELISFTHFNNTTENSVIPLLVKLRENEIVFIGQGGCGQVSRQRISILTRESQ